MQKMKILNFFLVVVKMCSNELKKNHLGHFDWNWLVSRYSIGLQPNTQNMAILAENRHLRLKVMLKGPQL